jgi:hypothetical protein
MAAVPRLVAMWFAHIAPRNGRQWSSSGHPGNVILAPTGGNVGVRETSPIHTLEIKVGGTTLADEWITPSSRRFKTNIHPLERSAAEGRAGSNKRGDIAAMESLLADDFVITVEDGSTLSKSGYIARNRDSTVHVYGASQSRA